MTVKQFYFGFADGFSGQPRNEKNIEWIDKANKVILELHEHYAKGCSASVINAFAHKDVKLSWRGENLIFEKL